MFTTSLTANDLLLLLQGAWTTLAITAMAMLIGTLLGVVFGLLRALLPRACRWRRCSTYSAACRC